MNIFKKKKKEVLTITEFARSGGQALKKKYGAKHYAEIAKKGRKTLLKRNPNFYKELSRKGVEARLKKMKEKRENEKNATSIDSLANVLSGK